jgi:hypothetical protein
MESEGLHDDDKVGLGRLKGGSVRGGAASESFLLVATVDRMSSFLASSEQEMAASSSSC